MSKGKNVTDPCSTTKTLLKTITQTGSVASGANSSEYSVWAANEFTEAYDALLIRVETTNPTGCYLVFTNTSKTNVFNFSSASISHGCLLPATGVGYTAPGDSMGATRFTVGLTFHFYGAGSAWSGTVTIKIYGINFA